MENQWLLAKMDFLLFSPPLRQFLYRVKASVQGDWISDDTYSLG